RPRPASGEDTAPQGVRLSFRNMRNDQRERARSQRAGSVLQLMDWTLRSVRVIAIRVIAQS
ncbi:hypothetical protein, partial [Xanthomonas perforans]|uniref:hypothetical protein n=1 Tax=Xanthomonas perforans TaxID=442694 RepID=UPI001F2A54F6